MCHTKYKAHCAQHSTAQTKKEEKKGKNGGHDNSAQIDDREKANETKKHELLLMLSVTAAHHPA